ncbi:MAG: transcriptional regulator [candidate division Zixibacteria bacterium DG_27]|nr:MAG: transcriptional regulator [candidate division Zixibacteria bacterium DG_27]
MSGHSKWSSIKRKKGKADAERGKVFTKLIREITVVAREGGGDPEANARLRSAIAAAKAANMPADNIKKAVMKGTGELPGVSYEAANYEGYGPGGVAVLVDVLTDNKNRTVAEIRHLFTKNGGNLGEAGCVGWMFQKRGYITVPKANATEDALLEIIVEAGAQDMEAGNDYYEITTPFTEFEKVRKALESKSIPIEDAEITMVPQTTVKLEGKHAEQMLRLMEAIEDHDDVQNVYANFDIEEEIMEKLAV